MPNLFEAAAVRFGVRGVDRVTEESAEGTEREGGGGGGAEEEMSGSGMGGMVCCEMENDGVVFG